jgi:hypothetical protein
LSPVAGAIPAGAPGGGPPPGPVIAGGVAGGFVAGAESPQPTWNAAKPAKAIKANSFFIEMLLKVKLADEFRGFSGEFIKSKGADLWSRHREPGDSV